MFSLFSSQYFLAEVVEIGLILLMRCVGEDFGHFSSFENNAERLRMRELTILTLWALCQMCTPRESNMRVLKREHSPTFINLLDWVHNVQPQCRKPCSKTTHGLLRIANSVSRYRCYMGVMLPIAVLLVPS